MNEYVLKAVGITKSFREGDGEELSILKGVDLTLSQGKSYAVVGNSGSGKSTLLEILATLLPPDGGSLRILGEDPLSLSRAKLASIRNKHLGFVFQNSQLLVDFNALENVMMPLLIKGEKYQDARKKAFELLSEVGLASRVSHLPSELSGGERQRIAVARAIVCRPQLVFADEPTGSLDEGNAKIIEGLLLDLVRECRFTLLLVTHNRDFAIRCDEVMTLRDGRLS